MRSTGLDLQRDQSGFSGLLVVMAILGASLLGLSFLNHRTELELRAEAHREWVVDRLKVRSALKAQTFCRAIDLGAACPVGHNLVLRKKSGDEFVANDGSTRFGRWNVKIECRTANPTEYKVMIASVNDANTFNKDPLTHKTLSWTELMSLKEVCGKDALATILEKSSPCFGFSPDSDQLPPELVAASGCADGCEYAGRYCGEAKRSFPSCPDGYQATFRYVDRYGWGGIDFTKYTICSKL